MASEKYSELIQAIDSEPLKEILLLLTQDLLNKTETIKKQNAQIRELRNEVTDLKERISEQEKYSSKDTIIINNLPLLQDADLVSSVLYFFKTFLDIQLLREDLKACHFLGKCSDINKPPPVVVKFVYFHQKNDVYVRRSMLGKRGKQNPINTENIYINERLPKEQLLIKKYANDKGLITTTYNCDVKLFLKDSSGATFSQKVTSTKMVDDLTHKALKKQRHSQVKRNVPDSTPENPKDKRFEIVATPIKNDKSMESEMN